MGEEKNFFPRGTIKKEAREQKGAELSWMDRARGEGEKRRTDGVGLGRRLKS